VFDRPEVRGSPVCTGTHMIRAFGAPSMPFNCTVGYKHSSALKYVLYKENIANLEWTSLSALVLEVDIEYMIGGVEGFGHMDQQQRHNQVWKQHHCCVSGRSALILTRRALTGGLVTC
jgi:hypothetical protein